MTRELSGDLARYAKNLSGREKEFASKPNKRTVSGARELDKGKPTTSGLQLDTTPKSHKLGVSGPYDSQQYGAHKDAIYVGAKPKVGGEFRVSPAKTPKGEKTFSADELRYPEAELVPDSELVDGKHTKEELAAIDAKLDEALKLADKKTLGEEVDEAIDRTKKAA